MQPAHKVANWLIARPNGAVRLLVVYVGFGEEVLWSSPASELGTSQMDAASALLALVQDDCNEARREVSSYQLRWLSEEGQVLGSRPLRVMPLDAGGNPRASLAMEEDGVQGGHPMVALMSVVLRHKEQVHKASLTATGNALKAQQDLISSLIAERKQSNDLLVALLASLSAAGGVQRDEDRKDSALDEAKAVALDNAARVAAEHLIPAAADLLKRHGDRLLAPPATEKADRAVAKATKPSNPKPPGKRGRPKGSRKKG